MENDLKEELNRRMRAAWAAFAAVREATDQDLRAHLFDSTVLPALCYEAETWADTAATSRKLFTTHGALERCLLKFNRRTQHLVGLRSFDLRVMSRLRDPAEYVSKAKNRWAGHLVRRIDDRWTKRTLEWIPREGDANGTSSTSLTTLENILDDNSEGTKRVEEMLEPARSVKMGHLNRLICIVLVSMTFLLATAVFFITKHIVTSSHSRSIEDKIDQPSLSDR
ncbi:hypothetical protein RB195_017634 [Necator americanus]